MRNEIKNRLEEIIDANIELFKNNYSKSSLSSYIASQFSIEFIPSNGIGSTVKYKNECLEIVCKSINKIESQNDHQIRITFPKELPYYSVNITSNKFKKQLLHYPSLKNNNIVIIIQFYKINNKLEAIFAYILPKRSEKFEINKMSKYFTKNGDRKVLTIKDAVNNSDVGAYFYSYSSKDINEY